ncbi:MAG TPA: nuclear transport factor 2 family protein [Gallionella sp.]|nr:nuclear transport factor 2 family protein [Gallionella sp.]
METQETITGDIRPEIVATPLDALTEFYYAFNHRDMGAMSANWQDSPEIAMSNPLGGIRRGWAEIRGVYERIFNGTAQVYVEYHDYTLLQNGDMFCAVGRERGWFRKGGEEVPLAIRTSRIFMRHDGRWRQVHHHGSIDDPALLDRYQKAVQTK